MNGRKGKSAEVLHAERQGALLTLTLNRPDANNAINEDLRAALIRAVEDIRQTPSIQAVVITSTGEEAFSVGHEIAEIAALTPLEAETIAKRTLTLHRHLSELEQPVIIAIKGACLGAGFELALHGDIRLARNDARFGFPGINVGVTSSGSALGRLQQLAGTGSAAALALTGGMVTADRAFMLGIVSNVAGPKDFELSIHQLAAHLTTLSPVALRETKRMLRLGAMQGIEAAAAQGPRSFAACYEDGAAKDRLRLLFGGPGPEATVH